MMQQQWLNKCKKSRQVYVASYRYYIHLAPRVYYSKRAQLPYGFYTTIWREWCKLSSSPDGGYRNHIGVAHSYCNELLLAYDRTNPFSWTKVLHLGLYITKWTLLVAYLLSENMWSSNDCLFSAFLEWSRGSRRLSTSRKSVRRTTNRIIPCCNYM